MPSKTKAQQRLMRAAAHTPGGFGGVPQKVGRDFVDADKRAHLSFCMGGMVPGVPHYDSKVLTCDTKEPKR